MASIHARVHNDLFADHSHDVVDRLHTITVPTLVMCGEHDWICPPDQSTLIASEIPNAKLVVVPRADHAVPDDVALSEVTTFLAEHPCPSAPPGTGEGGREAS